MSTIAEDIKVEHGNAKFVKFSIHIIGSLYASQIISATIFWLFQASMFCEEMQWQTILTLVACAVAQILAMQLVDYVMCFMFKQLKVPMKKY